MLIDHPNASQRDLVKMMVAQKGLPMILYKYRRISPITYRIFKEKTLWFSSPRKFNDPFDLQVADNGSYTERELRDYLIARRVPRLEIERIVNDDKAARGAYVAAIVENARDVNMNSKGVLSMSRRRDSVLMWTHYAGEHSGIVLGFSVLDDPSLFFTPVNIKYKKGLPSLSFIRDGNRATQESLKWKATDWKYEEEVRIYKSKPQAFPFDPKCLKEVILGIRIEAAAIARVMKLLDRGPFDHVKVKQGVVSKTRFAVDTVDVARL